MAITRERTVRPLPTWLVSARNGSLVVTKSALAEWRPFGVHHARQVGSSSTACGLSAMDWELFWDLAFPSQLAETCRECLHVVASTEASTHRSTAKSGTRKDR